MNNGGAKWLIQGNKHHKDDQLQSIEPPVKYLLKSVRKWYIKLQSLN